MLYMAVTAVVLAPDGFYFEIRDGESMLQHNGTDLIDRKILQELSCDARLPVAELGRRIKLSPSATAERVRRLESLELIRGYRADINLQALGFSITAFGASNLRRKTGTGHS